MHLNVFHNETQVRDILTSQGFALTDLSYDQVRVKGSFLKLKAVKASLETLLDSQTKTDITPSPTSPVPKVSSGAISKHYTNRPDANRSRLGSQNKHASPSSPTFSSSWVSGSSNNLPTSPEYSTSFSPTPDQRGSFRVGKEFFVVDADVFDYAKRLRKKDIDSILDSHNVRMMVHPVGGSYKVTLQGKSTRVTVGKLQSLLDDLNKSLRTQEVPLKDMTPEGKALLERIQKNTNIYNSVLVCPKNDKLHLIGPSGESYDLKQSLLGRPVDRSGRTGRTRDKNPRRRSSSLPPISRKNTEGDSGVGAAGYSPSKYQDIKQEGTEPKPGAAADLSGLLRRRSHSDSRHRTPAGRTTGNVQDMENKHPPPKSPKKGLTQLLKFNTEDIKQMARNLWK